MNKKNIIAIWTIIISIGVILVCTLTLLGITKSKSTVENGLKALPKPQITGGSRGELGIDKNINESTIDDYLGRPDSVYRDMRLLEDPATYENIGGDRFLSGYVKGFEVIPLPYLIPVEGLPDEVGDTYTGNTLFYNDNGTYVANYKESLSILEEIFPKDKVIFLMCGGGGYAGMTKNFLVSMGWDENKIYNVGGYWYYKGKNNVEVPKVNNKYDFSNVPYHEIDFDKLTKADKYQTPKIKPTEIKLNSTNVEIEVGTSFKLSAIVLPNEAYKEIVMSSSDEKVATISEDGLIKGISPGKATITVKSAQFKISTTCEVTILKKNAKTHVNLDYMPNELKEFNSYWDEMQNISNEFMETVYIKDEEGNYRDIKEEYRYYNDKGVWVDDNEAYKELEKTKDNKIKELSDKRTALFDKLIDQKKSFILLVASDGCTVRDYSIHDAAEKIFKQHGYQYFAVGDYYKSMDRTLYKTKMNKRGLTQVTNLSVMIIKEGQIFAYIDPDKDGINSDEETINWLSKYIDL